MTPENAIDRGIIDADIGIALKVPNDPNGSQVLLASQMKNSLHRFQGCGVRVVPGNPLLVC